MSANLTKVTMKVNDGQGDISSVLTRKDNPDMKDLYLIVHTFIKLLQKLQYKQSEIAEVINYNNLESED